MQLKIFVMSMTLMLMTTVSASAIEHIGGQDAGLFGNPTTVQTVTVIGGQPTPQANIDRSKNSAQIPPLFGGGTAQITSFGESITQSRETFGETNSPIPVYTSADGLLEMDGSLGTLSIPKLRLAVTVYQGEDLENLKKGVGHFESTSCWDGNVGFAAHNRGTANYFGQIHLLEPGDTIQYRTRLGIRIYEVYSIETINETDFSRLGYTDKNTVTLITCVRDIPELRWCVQAKEVV